jgi:hypothetical protein
MELSELKARLTAIEPALSSAPFSELAVFVTNGRPLRLLVTERLMRLAKKGRVWKTPAFLTALKNAAYGFDEARARSLGGADGVFLVDRGFSPKNEMMRKLFDRYVDRPGSGIEELSRALGARPEELVAARLVSHHMRLLGLLRRTPAGDALALVDYDAA